MSNVIRLPAQLTRMWPISILPPFRNSSPFTDRASKRTRSLLARVGGRAPEAIEILGLHKHELIALVRTHGVADGREPAGAVQACG